MADSFRTLFSDLETFAMEKTVLSSKQMSRVSRAFIKRLLLRQGHRVQVFGDCFTKNHFYKVGMGSNKKVLKLGILYQPYVTNNKSTASETNLKKN